MSKTIMAFGWLSDGRRSSAAVASAPQWARPITVTGLVALAIFMAELPMIAAETNSVAATAAAYTRTITQRAEKIVATLGVADTNQAARVTGILVQQYRDLAKIHDERDAHSKQAREKAGADKAAANTAIETVRGEIKPKLDKLHGEFLARLSRELSAEQVDKVKDGLTFGVVPLTYGVYLKMYPELTVQQQAQIKAWLTEARELAMDGGTAEEKHAVFGKYKGKINNYLSKAGYDAKQAEQNLRQPAAPAPGKKSN